MKRLFCSTVLVLSLPFVLVAASLLQSNSIGQERGPYTGEDPYYLLSNGEGRELWGPEGMLWKELRIQEETGSQIISRFAPDGMLLASQTFFDGILKEEQLGPYTYIYFYAEDGRLERVNRYQEASLLDIMLFSYTPITGRLLAVITIKGEESSIRYFSDEGKQTVFTYADKAGGRTFLSLQGTTTITKTFSSGEDDPKLAVVIDETGSFTIDRTMLDGTKSLEQYDERGILILKETSAGKTEYQYNEGNVLVSEHTTNNDGTEVVIRYEEGEKKMIEERSDGRLTSIQRFLDDGTSVQTLYSAGRAYCDVTYAAGGTRILSITYR